jgi:hypothetical protein
MTRKRLDELRPGMVAARPVYNLHNILLLQEGALLTEKVLRVLKTWGVSSVHVRNEQESQESGDAGPGAKGPGSLLTDLRKRYGGDPRQPAAREILRVAALQIDKRSRGRPAP